MADNLLDALIKKIGKQPTRLLLAGPAGIGKSRLARKLTEKFRIAYIEHDDLKQSASCTLHNFDPYHCFAQQISSQQEFVIDIGAGTIFRKDKDNDARFNQMVNFKRDYGLTIVVLTAERDFVLKQFLNKGTIDKFNDAWGHWEVAYPFWLKCADSELKCD